MTTWYGEKMPHISNYPRNANQNHSEYYHIHVRMDIIKSAKNNKFWRGCGETEPLYTIVRI